MITLLILFFLIVIFGVLSRKKPTKTRIINFQNSAEQKFRQEKNIVIISNYLVAIALFLLSNFYTQLKLPVVLLRRLKKKEKLSKIIDAGSENFYQIKNKNRKVLVNFWADWCGPCNMMEPFLAELSERDKSVKVVKVNIGNREICKELNVKGVPQTILFEDGFETKRSVGPMTLKDLEKFVSL